MKFWEVCKEGKRFTRPCFWGINYLFKNNTLYESSFETEIKEVSIGNILADDWQFVSEETKAEKTACTTLSVNTIQNARNTFFTDITLPVDDKWAEYINEAVNKMYKEMLLYGSSTAKVDENNFITFESPYKLQPNEVYKREYQAPTYEKDITKPYGIITDGCSHSWQKYVGLTQVYVYCEHCDLKRKENE